MSISKFWKEAVAYRLGGGHLADHKTMNVPSCAVDNNGNITGLVTPNSHFSYSSFLESTWQDINAPLAQGCTVAPLYRTHIDSVNGNDAWDGTVPVWSSGTIGPKRTAVVANWTGTKTSWFTDEILLFCAGQTHTLTDSTASIGLGTRKHLGAYWVASAPNAAKPVIRSLNNFGGTNSNTRACINASGTLTDISISDLTIDTQDVPNRCGISFTQYAAGQSINNITFSNLTITNGTITDTNGYGAIAITYYGQYPTVVAYPASTNILYNNCTAVGYPGFGFVNNGTLGTQLANGRWSGVDLINCTADSCGAGFDTHGFTSYSGGVKTITNLTWTLASSTIYWVTVASIYGAITIPQLDMLYINNGSGTETFKLLQNTATPTTPVVGEYGIDVINQKVYINIGVAPTTISNLNMCVRSTRGVRYIRCVSKNQYVAGRSGTAEGHGFAADDFVSNMSVIESTSINNAGHGVSLNKGDNNQIVSSIINGNALAAVNGDFGWGHYIGKTYLGGSGSSNSDPIAPYGFIHFFAASHKAYTSYTGSLPAPNTYRNVIASSKIVSSVNQATGTAILGPSSTNAPPIITLDSEISVIAGTLTTGRSYIQGRSTSFKSTPNHIRGIGPQA